MGKAAFPYLKMKKITYPFKKPGEISEVCVEQENALDSNFGNFLPQNIEMIRFPLVILFQ
jgi:ABC-type transport system involved in cytochrome bd biosynthesis fused ATPase/permease subunit